MRIALRCWLATVLVHYGVAKLIEIQFREPPAWILDQRVGDKSPMGLLWTFMGHSRPYTIGVGARRVLRRCACCCGGAPRRSVRSCSRS